MIHVIAIYVVFKKISEKRFQEKNILYLKH